jgi:hypothetical protein
MCELYNSFQELCNDSAIPADYLYTGIKIVFDLNKHKMKKLIRLLFIAVVLLAFGTAAFAQVTTTATATATVITPIAISKTTDMNFGTIAVSTALGTVEMLPDNTRTPSGGVTLPATAGTVTAAAFTVTGLANSTYTITIPLTATTITSVALDNMTVDTWTSTPTLLNGVLDGAGSEIFYVGATLHVAGSQPAGVYVSGTPFSVTVNYN